MHSIARHLLPTLIGVAILGFACSDADDPFGPTPAFPVDYAASYVQVRSCQLSGDHELSPVRVLADSENATAFVERDRDFTYGAVLLKVEYEFGDRACEGTPQRWTVMQREGAGTSPETLDWYWQDVDSRRVVVSENDTRCIGCHTGCGAAPDGYFGTCSMGASLGDTGAP